jgi:hypothetical protein
LLGRVLNGSPAHVLMLGAIEIGKSMTARHVAMS